MRPVMEQRFDRTPRDGAEICMGPRDGMGYQFLLPPLE